MKATLSDWERVLKQMTVCDKTEGWIDFVDSKLQFFEENPNLEETVACFISKQQIFMYFRSHHHEACITEY